MRYKITWSVDQLARLLAITAAAWLLTLNAAAAGESKIGFVDVQKAISSTKEWKKGFAAFKISFQKQKLLISKKENTIKKLLEGLNKQSFILDPKLKKQKEDDFRKQKVAFERYVEDQNNDFAKQEKEMTRKFLLQMIEVLQKLGKDLKYTMILEKKSVLYHDKGRDLTNQAIKAYDRKYK